MESPQFIWFFTVARALLRNEGPRCAAFVGVLTMLFAIGAASAALDAIKSIAAAKPDSPQPIGFGSSATSWSADSAAPAASSTAATGFSAGPQISPDNLSALLAAQGQSTGFSSDGTGANFSSLPTAPSSVASSTYGAIDQLTQRAPAPVLLPAPISVTA
jgi:hypothetical protein